MDSFIEEISKMLWREILTRIEIMLEIFWGILILGLLGIETLRIAKILTKIKIILILIFWFF